MNRCLNKKEKKIFFSEVNRFYKYDQDIIDGMLSNKINICDQKTKDSVIINTPDNVVNDILEMLKNCRNFLNEKNVDYWLDGGTLLGAVKYGKFIEWDDDADLGIPGDSFLKLVSIIKELKKVRLNKTVSIYLSEKYNLYFHLKLAYPNNYITDTHNKYLKIKVYDSTKPIDISSNSLSIDLLLYNRIKDFYSSVYSDDIKKGWVFKVEDVWPLKTIKFSGLTYNCVKNPIPFLDTGYTFWRHLSVSTKTHVKLLIEVLRMKIYISLKMNTLIFLKNKHY